MTNAYAQAQKVAHDTALTTNIHLPLLVLQDLLQEIDRLQAELSLVKPVRTSSVAEITNRLTKETQNAG